MDIIYNIMDLLLPFQWMEYDFMKSALLAILIITPLFGILGTMIVNNRMAFFSDALGHSALTGMALGVVMGISNMNLAMVIFGIGFAYILNRIKRRNMVSTDTVISVLSSFSMAVGLVILSKGGEFAKYSNLLVGDILSITRTEIIYLIVIFIATLLFWCFGFNQLLSTSVNESLARSKGVNSHLIEDLFSIIIAVIVMFSIKWVGVLIINALLILPAAGSRNISSNMMEYHVFSVVISVFSGVLGLIISYYFNTATGPSIVLVSSLIFFITLISSIFNSKSRKRING